MFRDKPILKLVGYMTLLFFTLFLTSSSFSFDRQTALKKENEKKKTMEKNLEAHNQNNLKKDEDEKTGKEKNERPETGFKVKAGEKKIKKKFPWLFVLVGAAATGIVIALLAKKKRDSKIPDWQYTGSVEPNYDVSVMGIDWVKIPAGEFQMGDNFSAGPSYSHPVHAVYLDEYYISKFEVTFAQYEKFCQDRGWNIPDDEGDGKGNRPVIHVNSHAARAFCRWLSQKTGKNIHLPTEAQWEKAARGTDQRRFPWGNAPLDPSLLNYEGSNLGKTMPVGSYPAGVSPYGVHDMAGNVHEICQDYYDPNYYAYSPYRNPLGPASGTHVVTRGGSTGPHIFALNSYGRMRMAPYRDFCDVGFRVVWEK